MVQINKNTTQYPIANEQFTYLFTVTLQSLNNHFTITLEMAGNLAGYLSFSKRSPFEYSRF